MAINQVPGVGPQNSDIATAVATAVPTIAQITSAVTTNAASAGVTMAAITSSIITNAASAGLTAAAIVSAGNAAGWASAAPSYPLGATSVVFSGYSSTGNYKYGVNVGAGSYIIDAVSRDPNVYMIAWAPNSNTTAMFKSNGTDKGILRLTTTENPIWFSVFGDFNYYGNLRVPSQNQSFSVQSGKNKIGLANGWLWHAVSNNYVLYSNDGRNWSTAATPGSNPYGTYSTLWDGTYYIVGYYNAYFRSTNLTSWSSVDMSATNIYDVNKMLYRASNTNKYLAVGGGGIATSANGTTWTQRFNGGNTWHDVETNNAGTYVAVGSQQPTVNVPKIYYSTNEGVNWTSAANTIGATIFNSSGNINQVAYGNGIWVVAGNVYDGTDQTSYNAVTAWSTDAVNWYQGTSSGGQPSQSVQYSNMPKGRTTQFLEFINGIFFWGVATQFAPSSYRYYYSVDGKQFILMPDGAIPDGINGFGGGITGVTKDYTSSGTVIYWGNPQYSGQLNRGMLWTNTAAPTSMYLYSIPSQTVLN
jgi:hypothetical protein